jgi:hypothetical protein
VTPSRNLQGLYLGDFFISGEPGATGGGQVRDHGHAGLPPEDEPKAALSWQGKEEFGLAFCGRVGRQGEFGLHVSVVALLFSVLPPLAQSPWSPRLEIYDFLAINTMTRASRDR